MRIRGNLRVHGAPEVRAAFVVEEDRLTVEVDGVEVGAWAVTDLTVRPAPDGLHVRLEDGEELVVLAREEAALVEALTGETPPPPSDSPRRPRRRSRVQRWLRSHRVRWALAFAAVLVVIAVAVTATGALGRILALAGMLALVLAALATADDPDAYRLVPTALSERALLVGGLVLTAVGLGLMVVDAAAR